MAKDSGTGQTSPNQNVGLTLGAKGFDQGAGNSEGEGTEVGSRYSATLTERENKSNTRNKGPSRNPGAIGGATLPVVRQTARKTGKL